MLFGMFEMYCSMNDHILDLLGWFTVVLGVANFVLLPSGGVSSNERKIWRGFIISAIFTLLVMLLLSNLLHMSGRLLEFLFSCVLDGWLLYFLFRRVKERF